MTAARVLMAALVLSASPLSTNAQGRLPEVGVVPSDWSEYGRALAAANRNREAIAAYERALQEGGARAGDHACTIARLYARLGNEKQAVRWIEHAIDLGLSARELMRRSPELSRFREDLRLNQLSRPLAVSKDGVLVLTSSFR